MIAQLVIATFGLAAIYLVNHDRPELHKWGPVCGLISQPFWLWETASAGQWGIFFLSGFYAYSWWRGLRNRW